jgi:hypothetical protein
MKLSPLFDPEREKAIRDALKAGKCVFSCKKPAEPPALEHEQSAPYGSKLPPAITLDSDPPKFKVGNRVYTADEYLLLAIEYGDFEAAKVALDTGADVNHIVRLLPVRLECTEVRPTRLGSGDADTPLKYAQQFGNRHMADFLRRHGAKE